MNEQMRNREGGKERERARENRSIEGQINPARLNKRKPLPQTKPPCGGEFPHEPLGFPVAFASAIITIT